MICCHARLYRELWLCLLVFLSLTSNLAFGAVSLQPSAVANTRVFLLLDGGYTRVDYVPSAARPWKSGLEIEIIKIHSGATGSKQSLCVYGTWRNSAEGTNLTLWAQTLVDGFDPACLDLKCSPAGDYCNGSAQLCPVGDYGNGSAQLCDGYSGGQIPVQIFLTGRFLYPFDSADVSQELTTDPPVEWEEVTLYNRDSTFEIVGIGELKKKNNSVELSLSLRRPVATMVAAAALILAWALMLVALLRAVVHFLEFSLAFLVLFIATLGLRLTALSGALASPSLLDLLLLASAIAGVIIIVARGFLAFRPRQNVFVSYRRSDAPWQANLICDRLKLDFGKKRCFIDHEAIDPGAPFPQRINDAIAHADVLIAVMGPNWLDGHPRCDVRAIERDSDWPRLEMEQAHKHHVPVLPVLVDREMPGAQTLPDSIRWLAELHALRLRSEHQEADLDAIVKTVRRLIEGAKKG